MKKFRTSLLVWLTFEQGKEDDEIERPDDEVAEEIGAALGCKAQIIERSDREVVSNE